MPQYRERSEYGSISRGSETLALLIDAGSDRFKYMLFVIRFLASISSVQQSALIRFQLTDIELPSFKM